MLMVDLRDLQRGPVETVGVVSPDDEVLQGLGLDLTRPLDVQGKLQSTGDGEVYWRGAVVVDARVEVLFSTDPETADDPGVYPLGERATHVDLGPVLREELALTVPSYFL